jgi:hypothetical protein
LPKVAKALGNLRPLAIFGGLGNLRKFLGKTHGFAVRRAVELPKIAKLQGLATFVRF